MASRHTVSSPNRRWYCPSGNLLVPPKTPGACCAISKIGKHKTNGVPLYRFRNSACLFSDSAVRRIVVSSGTVIAVLIASVSSSWSASVESIAVSFAVYRSINSRSAFENLETGIVTVVPSKFAKCTVASFAVSNFGANASSRRHLSRSCNPRSGISGPLRSASGWWGWSQPQALSKLDDCWERDAGRSHW